MSIKNITLKGAVKELPITIVDFVSNIFSMAKSRKFIGATIVTIMVWFRGLRLCTNVNEFAICMSIVAGVWLGVGVTAAWERRANGGNDK